MRLPLEIALGIHGQDYHIDLVNCLAHDFAALHLFAFLCQHVFEDEFYLE